MMIMSQRVPHWFPTHSGGRGLHMMQAHLLGDGKPHYAYVSYTSEPPGWQALLSAHQ
jgi:hypothetical protein